MYYLTVINRTAAILDGTDPWMTMALKAELALIVYSYFEVAVLFYILCISGQYHYNLSLLLKQLVLEYFVSMLARSGQIAMQLWEPSPEILHTMILFKVCVFTRNRLVLVSFTTSFFAMIERALATHYIEDYEIRHRKHIGWILVASIYAYNIICATALIFGFIPAYLQFFILIVQNLITLMGSWYVERVNIRRYLAMTGGIIKHYSLSERLQLAENIQTAQPFKIINTSLTLFNMACVSFIFAESDRLTCNVLNWIYVAFNYCCVIYGIFIPILILSYSSVFKKKVRCLLRMMCPRLNVPNKVNPRGSVTGTMGNNIMMMKTQETEAYFMQLAKDWS